MTSPFPARLVRFALVALAVTFCLPAMASADAPDVTSARGFVTAGPGPGERTVRVEGTWAWNTHGSDCNANRSGVGIALDWGDTTPGQRVNFLTTLNGQQIFMGDSTDNVVHPAEPKSFGLLPGDIPRPDAYSDWRGGCGTFATHSGTAGDPFNRQLDGTPISPPIPAGKYPAGTWGCTADTSNVNYSGCGVYPTPSGHYLRGGLTHTYPASFTGQIRICAISYDVHGKSSDTPGPGGVPNGEREVTAGGPNHAQDNSAEKNASTFLGNSCAPVRLNTQPTLDTNATVLQANPQAGSTIADRATLGGLNLPASAGGTIDFYLFGPDNPDCSNNNLGSAIAHFTVPVNHGNGNYDSPTFIANNIGDYRWIANYSGDAATSNDPVTNSCGKPNELVHVGPARPTVTTQASPDRVPNEITLGNGVTISDSATLSGASNPTGQLTFQLFGPGDANCSGPVAYSKVVLAANFTKVGSDYTANSGTFKPIKFGEYRWKVNYGGDPNNVASPNGCFENNELVTVKRATTFVDTEASAPITLGAGTLTDKAILSGATTDPVPTGTIKFTLYGPNDPDCTGTPAFGPVTRNVTGNGTYTSQAFTPTKAGTYHWIADYISTDDANLSTSNDCNEPNENVVVKGGPTVTTDAGLDRVLSSNPILNDTATLADGVNPTGKITFALYGPGNATCSGNPIFTAERTVNGNGTYTTPNGFGPVTQAGTYRWIANYSGDNNNNPATGACNDAGENVVVRNPNIGILKKANQASVVAGDTITYKIDVTNTGDQRFAEATVDLEDLGCDPKPPTLDSKNPPDPGSLHFLDPGETWTYVCSHKTVAADAGTTYRNTATVEAVDEHNEPAGPVSSHVDTPITGPPGCVVNCGGGGCTENCGETTPHPAISINKTGPATATAGDVIPYLLDVTNTGDQSFTEANLTLTDALCGATPVLSSKNGDQSQGKLDPRETWTYTCSVPTAAGQTNVHNVGSVTGVPDKGPPVSATDSADTVLPAQAVAPLLPGVSRLRGPTGCIAARTHVLTVTGSRIKRVSFFLDGRYVGTRTKPNRGSTFTMTIRGAKLRRGSHRVVARVTYQPDTNPQTRTLTLAFARCSRALTPKFTG